MDDALKHKKLEHLEDVVMFYDSLKSKCVLMERIIKRNPVSENNLWLEKITANLKREAMSLKWYIENLGYDPEKGKFLEKTVDSGHFL